MPDAPTRGQPPPDQPIYTEHNPAHAEARNRIADRLVQMNSLHAVNAWEMRRRDPLGPHGVAFFYADVPPKPAHAAEADPDPGWRLCTATRLWLDGPAEGDLAGVLMRLVEQGTALGGELDPRIHMSNRFEKMARDATYLGVGVSSLDTSTGRWRDVMGEAAGVLHVPGRCCAILWDGARMDIDRRGESEYREVRVRSSGNLNTHFGIRHRPWTYDLGLAAEQGPVWRFLDQLNRLILATRPRPET